MLLLNLHTSVHPSNNLFQQIWKAIYFYLTQQCPAFVATLTCHSPISPNFILFPHLQMLFLSQSIWPLHYSAISTTGSDQQSVSPSIVWQRWHKILLREHKATTRDTWLPLLCYRTPTRKICHWPDPFPSNREFQSMLWTHFKQASL